MVLFFFYFFINKIPLQTITQGILFFFFSHEHFAMLFLDKITSNLKESKHKNHRKMHIILLQQKSTGCMCCNGLQLANSKIFCLKKKIICLFPHPHKGMGCENKNRKFTDRNQDRTLATNCCCGQNRPYFESKQRNK